MKLKNGNYDPFTAFIETCRLKKSEQIFQFKHYFYLPFLYTKLQRDYIE